MKIESRPGGKDIEAQKYAERKPTNREPDNLCSYKI